MVGKQSGVYKIYPLYLDVFSIKPPVREEEKDHDPYEEDSNEQPW
jgi:hypothetical protein